VADRDVEQDDPRLVAAARHALHDEEAVAAFAVDGDAAEDADRARALIERCVTCRDLHADIVAIGTTIRAVGSAEATGAARSAPRDFRLSASQAVRLRGGNVFQRAAARVVDGVASFGRPVGATMATLGLVGLLVGTVGLAPLGGAASMPIEAAGATAAPAAGGTVDLSGGNGSLSSPPGDRTAAGPLSSAGGSGGKSPATRDEGRPGPAPLALLFAGSIALLVVGVALLVAGSRRRRGAPARRATRT
jgi:hypothetical protein